VLLSWVEKAARAVAGYYEIFPVPRVDLTIQAGGPGKISGGLTRGEGGEASIRISVGRDTTEEDLASSWVLVHEMVHLAFPSMTGHEWIEEGIATYVEPLVRARAGLAPSDEIWRWLLWGLPRGLEAIQSRGLDSASSWAASYWGGALFCFLADVEIRKRTGNRKSLDDALRGILRAGGSVTVSWPIEKALAEGDRATGVPVLAELSAAMRQGPVRVDLADFWKKLGVSSAGGRIVYDDAAPLAPIRKGITTGTARIEP
jgi:predicted metalloprotease with PDZ domain